MDSSWLLRRAAQCLGVSTEPVVLDEAGAVEYVKRLLPLRGSALRPDDQLVATEIHGGNLNRSFRVAAAAEPERSVFVKHAPPYVKVLGPSSPLPRSRAALESAALRVSNNLAPLYTPVHLHFDAARAALVMEDLNAHELLRSELLAGRAHASDAAALGHYLGLLHAFTWRGALGVRPEAVEAYSLTFANEPLVELTSQFVFRRPYDAADPTNRMAVPPAPGADGGGGAGAGAEGALLSAAAALRADGRAAASAAELERVFRTSRQCLIHGDLHSGSVMVRRSRRTSAAEGAAVVEPGAQSYQTGRLRVIDAEFMMYGAPAFDLGLAFAAYALARACHAAVPAGAPARADAEHAARRLEFALEALWATYRLYLGRVAESDGAASTAWGDAHRRSEPRAAPPSAAAAGEAAASAAAAVAAAPLVRGAAGASAGAISVAAGGGSDASLARGSSGLSAAKGTSSRVLQSPPIADSAGPSVLELRTLREAAGFMGCELARRVLGAASCPELDAIGGGEARARASLAVLRAAERALERWRTVQSIGEVLQLVSTADVARAAGSAGDDSAPRRSGCLPCG